MKVSVRLKVKKGANEGSLLVIVYHNKNQKEFSLSRKLQPSEWNPKRQEAIGFHNQMLNVQIRNLKRELSAAIDAATVKGDIVNLGQIINKVTGNSSYSNKAEVNVDEPKILVDYIQRLIDDNQERLKVASLTNYRTLKSSITSFNRKALISEVDIKFVNDYHQFLQKTGVMINTIETRMAKLRKVVNVALKDGLTDCYPFGRGKYILRKDKNVKRKYLSQDEIVKLISYIPTNNSEAKVISILKFNLHCGLRIKDVLTLRKSDIAFQVNTETGETIYRCLKTTSKTETSINILLTNQAKEQILLNGFEQKKPNDLIFPWLDISDFISEKSLYDSVSSNTAFFNKILSQICKKCELPHISSHCIRHSFATTLINKGVPITSISKMLAHTSVNTTQIYCQIVQGTIDDHIKILEN